MSRPVALITGASRGIGLAIARDLGTDHHILVGGTDVDRVAAVVDELPSAEPFVVELTDLPALTAAVADVSRLDVLVHSAGITINGPVAEVSHDAWVKVLMVNVVAVADLTRLTLPALRAARGQVIAVNSGAGYTSKPTTGLYSASKFALRALTDALREEERGTVRVTSIHPGQVDTDMQRDLQSWRGNTNYRGEVYLTPDSVAKTVRLAVEATAEANIDELTIRPVIRS